MLGAHPVIAAILIRSGPAPLLGRMVLAHQAATAKILAADPHRARVDSHVSTTLFIAHATAPLHLES